MDLSFKYFLIILHKRSLSGWKTSTTIELDNLDNKSLTFEFKNLGEFFDVIKINESLEENIIFIKLRIFSSYFFSIKYSILSIIQLFCLMSSISILFFIYFFNLISSRIFALDFFCHKLEINVLPHFSGP